MEITEQSLLLEELMDPRRDNWTAFPNEFFPNDWTPVPNFDQTPDLSAENPSLLGLVSPEDICNNLCPFGEFQPFVDAFNSPEFSSLDDSNYSLPLVPVLPDFDNGFEQGPAEMQGNSISGGRNKLKKANGQPSKNLMAERRRRKRLNDRLSLLRSIVPKISKMDRTSILGDTIDYMKELLDKIHKLQEEGVSNPMRNTKELKPHQPLAKNPPKFDVERRNRDTQIEICCTSKPGLLLSTLSTFDALGLDIQHCIISCFNDFSLQASCHETAENQSVINSEDVKQALSRNAGYGGRCL